MNEYPQQGDEAPEGKNRLNWRSRLVCLMFKDLFSL